MHTTKTVKQKRVKSSYKTKYNYNKSAKYIERMGHNGTIFYGISILLFQAIEIQAANEYRLYSNGCGGREDYLGTSHSNESEEKCRKKCRIMEGCKGFEIYANHYSTSREAATFGYCQLLKISQPNPLCNGNKMNKDFYGLDPYQESWSEWSQCSVSCGEGMERRFCSRVKSLCQRLSIRKCYYPPCEFDLVVKEAGRESNGYPLATMDQVKDEEDELGDLLLATTELGGRAKFAGGIISYAPGDEQVVLTRGDFTRDQEILHEVVVIPGIPPEWRFCGLQGRYCADCHGWVRYGLVDENYPEGRWSTVKKTTEDGNPTACDSTVFGDPYPGAYKMCQCTWYEKYQNTSGPSRKKKTDEGKSRRKFGAGDTAELAIVTFFSVAIIISMLCLIWSWRCMADTVQERRLSLSLDESLEQVWGGIKGAGKVPEERGGGDNRNSDTHEDPAVSKNRSSFQGEETALAIITLPQSQDSHPRRSSAIVNTNEGTNKKTKERAVEQQDDQQAFRETVRKFQHQQDKKLAEERMEEEQKAQETYHALCVKKAKEENERLAQMEMLRRKQEAREKIMSTKDNWNRKTITVVEEEVPEPLFPFELISCSHPHALPQINHNDHHPLTFTPSPKGSGVQRQQRLGSPSSTNAGPGGTKRKTTWRGGSNHGSDPVAKKSIIKGDGGGLKSIIKGDGGGGLKRKSMER